MLKQLLLGAALVAITVVVQAVVTVVGLRFLDWLQTHERRFGHHHAIAIIVFFVLLMFAALVIDVWIWAGMYLALGALSRLEEALYFSTTTFTTLGYGDVVLSKDWRLLGSFEAANGLIIFGWATAFVIAAIQHFYVWRRERG